LDGVDPVRLGGGYDIDLEHFADCPLGTLMPIALARELRIGVFVDHESPYTVLVVVNHLAGPF